MQHSGFFRQHARLLGFGLLAAFFSSFGQSFFIGSFGNALKAEFALTAGGYGLIYSLATLASAGLLSFTGAWIDRLPLRRYLSLVLIALSLACLLMASARNLIWLGIAIFMLRQSGQGLMGHISMTTMARAFVRRRGKAVAVAALGFPLGQALLPRLAVGLTEWQGWRMTWLAASMAAAFLALPLMLSLLGERQRRRAEGEPEAMDADELADSDPLSGWTRRQVLRDRRFYLLLPAVLAPPFIATGIFVHQGQVAAAKGWALTAFTALFVGFSLAQILSSLIAGPMVDRFSARRLMPYYLLPMAAGLAVLGSWSSLRSGMLFLLLTGVSAGFSMTLGGAVWAELYGLRHLGAVRSLIAALGVFSTAVSPVLMGRLFDAGMSMERMAWLCAGYTLVSVLGVVGSGVWRGAENMDAEVRG